MLAIMNIGKYAPSYEPTGDVILNILSSNVINFNLDKIAFDGDQTIVGSEGTSNTIACSTDNGNTWQYKSIDYNIYNIKYIESIGKFVAIEESSTSVLHYGTSSNGLDWQWNALYTIPSGQQAKAVSVALISQPDNSFISTIFVIPTRFQDYGGSPLTDSVVEITVKNGVSSERIIQEKGIAGEYTKYLRLTSYNRIGYSTNNAAFVISYETSSTVSGSGSDYKRYKTVGSWGIEDLYYDNSTVASDSKKPIVITNKYIYRINSAFYYSYTGRKNSYSFKGTNILESTRLSFFELGGYFYMFTENKIAKAKTLDELFNLSITKYGSLGELDKIIDAFVLDDTRVVFTSSMGTVYVCSVK